MFVNSFTGQKLKNSCWAKKNQQTINKHTCNILWVMRPTLPWDKYFSPPAIWSIVVI